MALRAEVASPQPPALLTAGMGTEVPRGVALTGAALGHDDRCGWHWRGELGMRRLVLTQDTMGLVVVLKNTADSISLQNLRLGGDWAEL
jgi:hypothetical protein